MAKSTSWITTVVAMAGFLAFAAHASEKTPGDQIAEIEVTLELLQKQRQVNDMLGADPIVRALPSVVSIFVLGDKKTARLAMPGGVVQSFNEGDEIIERMKLLSVSARRVQVQIDPLPNAKSKKPVALALAFKPGINASAPGAQPAALAGMPAAPLSIPAGLMQATPMLPSPSGLWPGLPGPNEQVEQQSPASPALTQ